MRCTAFHPGRRLGEARRCNTRHCFPLKNNWRPLRGSGTAQLYEAMVNYVKGYASATSSQVLTSPGTHGFKSAQDGYHGVCEELQGCARDSRPDEYAALGRAPVGSMSDGAPVPDILSDVLSRFQELRETPLALSLAEVRIGPTNVWDAVRYEVADAIYDDTYRRSLPGSADVAGA